EICCCYDVEGHQVAKEATQASKVFCSSLCVAEDLKTKTGVSRNSLCCLLTESGMSFSLSKIGNHF
ncbi:unnamed protein product, partial [Musa textilis]